MARHISYKYKGEWKKIPFSYDKYADSFEDATNRCVDVLEEQIARMKTKAAQG